MVKHTKRGTKRSTPFDGNSDLGTLSGSLEQKIAGGPPSLTPLNQSMSQNESQEGPTNEPLTQVMAQPQSHAQAQSQLSMDTQNSEDDSGSGNSSDDPLSFLFSQEGRERGSLATRTTPTPIPKIPKISDTKNDGLPKLPSWMLSRSTLDKPSVPVPKNFFELAAYRQMDVRVDNTQADRYRVLNKNPDKPTIFEPLVQPKDLSTPRL